VLPILQKIVQFVLSWSIWKQRKSKLWNSKTETSSQIVERTKHLIEDWRKAKVMLPQQVTVMPEQTVTGWSRPPTKMAFYSSKPCWDWYLHSRRGRPICSHQNRMDFAFM